MLMLNAAYLGTKKELFAYLSAALSIAGALSSIWFVYIEAFLIHAFCFYCLTSAGISMVMFLVELPVIVACVRLWKGGRKEAIGR